MGPFGVRLDAYFTLLVVCGFVSSDHVIVPRTTAVGPRREVVCGDTDVRNMVENFHRQLANCTVIEGNLQILLIEHAQPSAYQQLSFPNLVEITDYLLLYRVYGLRTLAQLFPNLTVIRGQRLFFNYALVVFEMPNFETLGLGSLTSIVRGAVRMEKNPALCYIETIDWSRITNVNEADHFKTDNKVGECVDLCPKSNTGKELCSSMDVSLSDGQVRQQPLCWDLQSCQTVCPASCRERACYRTTAGHGRSVMACCHPQCLGGCTGPDSTQCTACVHVFYRGQCRERCPAGTYKYRERRCLRAEECEALAADHKPRRHWKILPDEGKCVEECPSGYTEESPTSHRCVRCDGPCPKRCSTISIDNVASAQKLRGCTIIEGVLEIQIRGGGHVGRELTASLGQLQEVTDHVIIKHTYDITSLNFLPNLRTIGGQRLYGDRYALVVFDNQNLQEIWDFDTHPNLTINNGHVFFHYNRKLCRHKIERLIKMVGLEHTTDDKDVARDTNGDKITCETVHIELEVVKCLDTFAIIRWSNFHTLDSREILSWVVNYREVQAENITIFSARDTCTTDLWLTTDVRPDNDLNASYVATFLHNLKPYTKYALYVQTYTIATAAQSAISSIVYFTTKPDVPTPPRDIMVVASGLNELTVSWKEPSSPNGNVTHYYVYWQPQVIKASAFDQRDYCVNKLRLNDRKDEKLEQEKPGNKTENREGCCECPKSTEEIKVEEEERAFQIEFENFLHDSVYVKRDITQEIGMEFDTYEADMLDEEWPVPMRTNTPSDDQPEDTTSPPPSEAPPIRKRREAEATPTHTPLHTMVHEMQLNDNYRHLMNYSRWYDQQNETEGAGEEGTEPYEAAKVYFRKEITLTNLKHFHEYNIEVIACHDYEEDQKTKHCSNRAITVARTRPSQEADDIIHHNLTALNVTGHQQVTIHWNDPPTPNGLILTYDIELVKKDISDSLRIQRCIPHKKYRDVRGYRTEKLESGQWSVRVRATSLAGEGLWSPDIIIYVPDLNINVGADLSLITALSVTAAIVVLIIIAAGAYFVAKRKYNQHIPGGPFVASTNPEYSSVYVADEWEVPREKVRLLDELGQGSFGMVYEGIATNLGESECETKVAVKTVNENASFVDRNEFLHEASVMKVFDCNHVVKLLGVVSKGQPTLVIMELMSNGDLRTFLRNHRPDEQPEGEFREAPSLKEILQMAGEIADGMAYLAAKKVVHRDLAARNCMVSETMVVKIGDFGMARDIYETNYYRKGGKGLLPIRWMSPESLKDGIFTSQSDVWSYGVVLWEMATLAAQPYQGLTNEEVLQFVIDGGMMEKPDGCPDRLYQMMKLCWKRQPRHRPLFSAIITQLTPDLSESFITDSFFYSDENQAPNEGVEDDADVSTPLTGGGGVVPRTVANGTDENSFGDEDDMSSSGNSTSTPSPPAVCALLDGGGGVKFKEVKDNRTGAVRMVVNGGEGDVEWSKDWRQPSPNPGGVVHSNEGSKGSSKSSNSSHMNGGLNGHVAYTQTSEC